MHILSIFICLDKIPIIREIPINLNLKDKINDCFIDFSCNFDCNAF